MTEKPSDYAGRERMRSSLEENISVRASAGSGKTRSTVDRVVEIARTQPRTLEKLVVVTYTNAAAGELRTRARKRLIEECKDVLRTRAGEILPSFDRIFFGTIHSFCMRLLGEFGYLLGLPGELENAGEFSEEAFQEFRRRREKEVWENYDPNELRQVFRFGATFEELSRIGRELSAKPVDWLETPAGRRAFNYDICAVARALRLDPEALAKCRTTKTGEKGLRDYCERFKRFCEAWNQPQPSGPQIPMLGPARLGGKDLMETSKRVLLPVHDWYLRSLLKLGLGFARPFQAHRCREGVLTYNDQVLLARRLVERPEIIATLRSREMRVILDESQDTTPDQFRILAEIARPKEAGIGNWPEDRGSMPPRPGHFVIVGDAQQSIYSGSGASIACYQRHHEALEEVEFHETFRCSRRIVTFVNGRFESVLHGLGGQAQFVVLTPRKSAPHGALSRIRIDTPGEWSAAGDKLDDSVLFKEEAQQVARKLSALQPAGLGIARWSDAAILMPRNDWLQEMVGELERQGIPCRMTARREYQEDVAYRWFTALLVTLARGDDGYELAGVLREIFAAPDPAMAEWVAAGRGLHLLAPPPKSAQGPLPAALTLLHRLRKRMLGMTAFAAVNEMLSETKLGARLEAMCKPGMLRVLRLLLARAAEAEARGETWQVLAEDLLAERDATLPEILPADGEDGIWLMTCQKAKGLEWDVVMLPGLGRPLRNPDPRDNLLEVKQDDEHGHDFVLAGRGLKGARWEEVGERAEARAIQEFGRIYYVACTRARNHLIVVDDRELWSLGRSSKLGSALSVLDGPAGDRGWLESIEELANSETAPARACEGRALSVPVHWESLGHIRPASVLHPSELDRDRREREAEDDVAPAQRRVEPLHAALIYGNWWHEAFDAVPWPASEAEKILRAAIPQLPADSLRERALKELGTLFRASLFKLLTRSRTQAHRELVYARSPDGAGIEDGKIDLLYRCKEGAWTLLDWKTDAVKERKEAEALAAERYGQQIRTYMAALRSFGLEIEQGVLYFTALGESVEIRPAR